VNLTVIVLTLNEEANLPDCLASLKPLAAEIVVVDSGSTDRTVEIAESFGARVVTHQFETQARQLNWALDNVPMSGEWVIRLDADERLTPELAKELPVSLPKMDAAVTGLYVKRRVFFMGKWIRRGGYYPTWILRAWRCGKARAEDRPMDEHMVLSQGRAGKLRHDIREDNRKGLFHWIARHNGYARREAQTIMAPPADNEVKPSLRGGPVARRRWLKVKVYGRMPLFVRPVIYFLFRYFIQLGFLDGRQGLVFHFLQGFWYRFLVDAYILEARREAKRS